MDIAMLIVIGAPLVTVIVLATRTSRRDRGSRRSPFRENYITDSLSPDGSPTNLYGEPFVNKDHRPSALPETKEFKERLNKFNYDSGFRTDQGSDHPLDLSNAEVTLGKKE